MIWDVTFISFCALTYNVPRRIFRHLCSCLCYSLNLFRYWNIMTSCKLWYSGRSFTFLSTCLKFNQLVALNIMKWVNNDKINSNFHFCWNWLNQRLKEFFHYLVTKLINAYYNAIINVSLKVLHKIEILYMYTYGY